MALNVAVLTPVPSPYQVELFDAVAAAGRYTPRVIYLARRHADRFWADRRPAHDHVVIPEGGLAAARDWMASADLAVFSWYSDPTARELMGRRAEGGRPWTFWGERPGFRRLGFVGRLRRRWRLRPLRRSRAPIWGIGSWAVDGWRREFGSERSYRNVPYFSDLTRFARPAREAGVLKGRRRFLFSGSLTRRKGVDLLADAFARVAAGRPELELDIVGTGDLAPAVGARLAGLGGRVRMHGFRDWRELPAYYHRAEVLIAPSRYDGWGLVVPEGLAAGLPVITTDRTGAARDLVRDGENGWVVRAGRRDELRRVLESAAGLTAELLSEMSQSAKRSVAGHDLMSGVRVFEEAAAAACGDAS